MAQGTVVDQFTHHTCEGHVACTCIDRQVLWHRAVSIDDRLVKAHIAIRCIQNRHLTCVIQRHQLSVVLFACRADTSTLDGDFVGGSVDVDVHGVHIGHQARSIHRADKLGLACAVDHQVAQRTVGSSVVFTHHASKHHITYAGVDGQVLWHRSVGIDDRFIKAHIAIRCIQNCRLPNVIQHHQLSVMLFASRCNTAALDDHLVGGCRSINTHGVNVSLQARNINCAHKRGYTFAVDDQVTKCTVLDRCDHRILTHHASKHHITRANVDRQVLRQCAVCVHDRFVKRHAAVCGVQDGELLTVVQYHQLSVVLFACRADTPALNHNLVARGAGIDASQVCSQASSVDCADKRCHTFAVDHQVTQRTVLE